LETRLLGWRLSKGSLAIRLARARGKRRVLRELLASRDASSATEVFRFFYRPESPLDIAVGDYFSLRFGQPRHLVAVCLLAQLPTDDKPVLDIACGCGHLDHYLTSRIDPLSVVGVDLNFFHAWIARHWIALAGAFVCANATEGLPFADNSFSATICSDAYHCIPERAQLNAEVRRCAPGRPGIITYAGNVGVMPNEGCHPPAKPGAFENVSRSKRLWRGR
jgi:SAM-dependent methyltransferase